MKMMIDVGKTTVTEEKMYSLLNALYHNSRYTVKFLSHKLGLSYYNTSKLIRKCESKYKLKYTININPKALGFTGSKIVLIKFEDIPNSSMLKNELSKDLFVQAAYFCKGDFDLLLYVVATSESEYGLWEWTLRAVLGKYKPIFFSSQVGWLDVGFMPLSSDLIKKSTVITDREKSILLLLNDNSRMRVREISRITGLSHFQVVNTLKSLKATNKVPLFSTFVQKPTKNILSASFFRFNAPAVSHPKMLKDVLKILLEEKFDNVTSDYALIYDLTGTNDLMIVCNFENSESYSSRGPELWIKNCKSEEVITQEAVMISVIKGVWPFHADKYEYLSDLLNMYENNPNIYIKIRDQLKSGNSYKYTLWPKDSWEYVD